VPVLLDGAQGLGVAAVDVRELGCTFYAAAGQKWLCGPIGCGYLYVSDDYIDRLRPTWPSFGTLADPVNPLTSEPRPGAARFDSSFPAAERTAAALAALQVLEAAGLSAVHERSIALAGELAARLSDLDMRVVSRGASSLVSWFSDAPRAESERLLGLGFLVRYLPGTQLIRASVGAWNTPEEIAGLASAAAQAQSEGT
jgi:L-cysteine/cystine lyase